jgi:UDP-N-acetylglucosamine--N-acetylmuramyl-(pentapeptide) pyrophosphoryl-undecaprenol N-acetylglucosamine transferase
LTVIGRPSLLVPYPFALDHDQAANAAALLAEGGAMVKKQAALSPQNIAEMIAGLAANPDHAERMAAAARATAKPDATLLLADLTEAIAAGKSVADFKKELRA